MNEPALTIDFKPQLSADVLRKRASNLKQPAEWLRAWKLNTAAVALMETYAKGDDLEGAIEQVQNFSVRVQRPRPIDEAISSAGGETSSELHERLVLGK